MPANDPTPDQCKFFSKARKGLKVLNNVSFISVGPHVPRYRLALADYFDIQTTPGQQGLADIGPGK
jgi:hypothetical protein